MACTDHRPEAIRRKKLPLNELASSDTGHCPNEDGLLRDFALLQTRV
jgi:hypothetical protein